MSIRVPKGLVSEHSAKSRVVKYQQKKEGERNRSPRCWRTPGALLAVEVVQRLLEAIRVASLRLGQGLEPIGDFVKAFVASGLGHTRIHIGVLVRFAGDRRFQVQLGVAHREACRGIADRLKVLEVSVRVTGLTFRG